MIRFALFFILTVSVSTCLIAQNDSVSNSTITFDKHEAADKTYQLVDQLPFFDKCTDKECSDERLINFISSHLKYPKKARKKGIQGRVFIQFVVKKDGSVGDAKIVREIGGGCGEEALKVVNSMNSKTKGWTPGALKGDKVNVLYTLPVTFKIGKKGKKKKG